MDVDQVEVPKEYNYVKLKNIWVNEMRKSFCIREQFSETSDIIDEEGNLNQQYFGRFKDESVDRSWGTSESEKLVSGIETFGIGHFREISDQLLPDWTPNELRVKAMRLIGRQNLQLYKDWKGGKERIEHEYNRNKQIGLSMKAWKGGVLVYDDDGEVLKAIEESYKADPPF
ncbi:hypothetical protein BB560_004891 [Smittium megazygosporum]|uniref:Myb-like domain-containing protein n=1 Tax=Smittium megazygosporum TaxID=133381 RepID=A0A2T9Z848_9FUNG|nr:hypothetical protein BB560_004891 [Smittium megazygosporum]